MAPLDFALPLRCAGCGDIRPHGGDFCLECWTSLRHLDLSGCPLCLTPMDLPGQVCARCMEAPPRHDGVMAAVDYGDVARALVLKLKYGRKPAIAAVMARLMVRHLRTREPVLVPAQEPVLVPVPLHRWRLWSRGFNQSLLIAQAVSRHTGQKIYRDVLTRRKRTRPLGGLGRVARAKEVAGVFAIDQKRRAQIVGKDILLVDDVYTTGATAQACAAVLKRAGARSVHILCWARVLQDLP